MEYKEFTGKTIEEAKENACKELNLDMEALNFEVVDEEKSGFLGLFKSAKIKVSYEIIKEESEIESTEVKDEAPITPAVPTDEEKAALAKAYAELGYNVESPADTAVDFLTNVLKEMQLDAEITAELKEEEETIFMNIEGADMGTLIGKRGQTLDALQYLTSLVVNRICGKYYKIKLDTENYRERRKETLENLSKNIAMKVKKSHRSVALEPMNPYERRIIHAALQNDKYVETHSEGEEPYRKVIISMKKGVTYENNRYGNNRYGNNRYGNGGGNRFGNGGNNRYGNNRGGSNYKNTRKPYDKNGKTNENGEKVVPDYMKDYAAYKEAKAAEKAAESSKPE